MVTLGVCQFSNSFPHLFLLSLLLSLLLLFLLILILIPLLPRLWCLVPFTSHTPLMQTATLSQGTS